jgi:hypothetical protein
MASSADLPWMAAWQEAERELGKLAGTAAGPDPAVTAAQQQLAEYARDYVGIAAAAFAGWQGGRWQFEALREPFIERYRQLFMPQGFAPTLANPANVAAGAAALRAQRATDRYARLAATIAADAGRRLGAALAASGPAAPPVTTLRELHALWIECGEAAWAAAAHREEFAAAQAELLAALVELRAPAAAR